MYNPELAKLPSLRSTIKDFGLEPNKKMGQNFLLDTHITDQIINAVGDLTDKVVLEIGAGPGCLTRSILASNAKKIIAVETDVRCIAALEQLQLVSNGRLHIINGDALKIKENELGADKLTIISNLPYNIGTALMLKWLETPELYDSITVMLQKEVVDRICASTRTSDYGRLSVICQWLCHCESLFDIEPENFYPPPKVISSVVKLVPRATPLFTCDRNKLEKITQQAFGMRRKMLRSALKPLFAEADIIKAGIDPTMRAEELTIEEFCRLALLLRTY